LTPTKDASESPARALGQNHSAANLLSTFGARPAQPTSTGVLTACRAAACRVFYCWHRPNQTEAPAAGFFFAWCWATCWLHGAKPCTAGYMVATWPGKQKTPLSFE